MVGLAVALAPHVFSVNAFILFLVSTYFSLLIGHSVGMHRLMIHRTFRCSKTLERALIYVGVLVGMSGPFSIIRIHDIRDWAQRKNDCHDFFSHKQGYLRDVWWQLTSKFEFYQAPTLSIEPHYAEDKFLIFCERTWRWHQLVLAALLYGVGGWSWVVWGVFVRVAVSVVGHWSITYFCHNPGPGDWEVKGAAVQASNLRGLGLVTYGECWHNNHHAFPESARIGLQRHQWDPAWWFICGLEKLNLVYGIRSPREQNQREDLRPIASPETD